MTLLCKHCTQDAPALTQNAIDNLLPQVAGWVVVDGKLQSSFTFRNYYETIAFVNALAWLSHQEDHHPELNVTYKLCAVAYNTHSAGGEVSENDFICAAKATALYMQRAVA